jgi:hypothetical protein
MTRLGVNYKGAVLGLLLQAVIHLPAEGRIINLNNYAINGSIRGEVVTALIEAASDTDSIIGKSITLSSDVTLPRGLIVRPMLAFDSITFVGFATFSMLMFRAPVFLTA